MAAISGGQLSKSKVMGWDSACTHNMAGDLSLLEEYSPLPTPVRIVTAGSEELEAVGAGIVRLEGDMYLKEVWYVPGLTLNLISVAKLAADGAQITISKEQLQLKKGSFSFTTTLQRNGVFLTHSARVSGSGSDSDNKKHRNTSRSEGAAAAVGYSPELTPALVHRRAGRPSLKVLDHMVRNTAVWGLHSFTPGDFSKVKHDVCEPCILSKQQKFPFPSSDSQYKPLGVVSSDLCGPSEPSHLGARYTVILVDHATGYAAAAGIKQKSDAAAWLQHTIALWENQTDRRVKIFRSDRGGVFRGFPALPAEQGHTTPAVSATHTSAEWGG